ncbi:hypothetical protein D3C83_34160 [compost metagenome]
MEGTTILRPNTSCTSTAAPSASRSTSATRITEFCALDSRSAGVPGTGFSFSSKPFGKAVLNFPVSRSASGRDLPEGWKPLVAASPRSVAFALSTSMDWGELRTSSLTCSPSTGFTWKAPPNA